MKYKEEQEQEQQDHNHHHHHHLVVVSYSYGLRQNFGLQHQPEDPSTTKFTFCFQLLKSRSLNKATLLSHHKERLSQPGR